ncbi:hypothetical protein KP806_01375 [Paenibacillus sp. N4]|uniref:hypothetical protein n=1 Tax=Paenibacillus vietnamensis TaxID=2590547 RepID=UPI001CD054C2|nr:hypothetical protein [Paenibacillus vietnamensis]MCA0753686.1 hypothetical protein [Paenibacillus vietnamensis]
MNKLKYIRIFLLAGTILSGCSQFGQENSILTTGGVEEERFNENDAIAVVLNSLAKDTNESSSFVFPSESGETKQLEAAIGGKAGTTTNVELTTNVEKKDESFIVKLNKDWNVTVGSKEVVSYWEYKVDTKAGVKLIKSEDNDNRIALIK